MPFVTDQLVVKSCGPDWWYLVDPVVYRGKWDRFEVPVDFITDFASVPKFATWLIPRYGIYTRAAVLHDYLCEMAHAGQFNRRDADGLFRRVLRELGVSGLRRWVMWAAVRLDSWMSDATFKEWLQFLLVAAVSLPVLVPPLAVATAWSLLFRVVEWLSGARQLRFEDPRPEGGGQLLR